MQSYDFTFRSVWRIPAELTEIWDTVGKVSQYPAWWPGIEKVDVLQGPELPISVGTKAHYVVASPFYRLQYQTEVKEFATGKYILADAHGDLKGTGKWTFHVLPTETMAVFDWQVRVEPTVLRVLSRLAPARAVMHYFHNQLMDAGEKGLKKLHNESLLKQKLPA
ncbi:MAG: SRPBCC family protein [Candidatus Andersenbacteria bacterium]|nr:SRPBCC family protein [Candidatus Andersenbacteria bacterium]